MSLSQTIDRSYVNKCRKSFEEIKICQRQIPKEIDIQNDPYKKDVWNVINHLKNTRLLGK